MFPPSRKSLMLLLLGLFLGSQTGILWCLNLIKLNVKRPHRVDFDLMGMGSHVTDCSRPAPLNSALRWSASDGRRGGLIEGLDEGDISALVVPRGISEYSGTSQTVFPCPCLWGNRIIYRGQREPGKHSPAGAALEQRRQCLTSWQSNEHTRIS